MLEKLTHRGCKLLDGLPGPLSSELMGIVAQSETILAKNLHGLLVDTLVDLTQKEGERVKLNSGHTSGTEQILQESGAEGTEQMLQELIRMARQVFSKLPSELSDGLLQDVLHGDTPLASLLLQSSDPSKVDMLNRLGDLVKCAATLFDISPPDLAEEITADVIEGNTPLTLSLDEYSLGAAPSIIAQVTSECEIDHIAAVTELVEKVMDSIVTRFASDPVLLMGLGEAAGFSGHLFDAHFSTTTGGNAWTGADLDVDTQRQSAHQGETRQDVDATALEYADESARSEDVLKMKGAATPRTPLSSIPEDTPVSIAAWVPIHSSVPQSLSTILAVLKFNNLDIAMGYDVFDYDEDGHVSLRDLRKKCAELALEISPEGITELFQALAGVRTGHISKNVWAESLANGDADSVLAKRGVAPDDIHLAHVVQDVLDDLLDTIVRQQAPKDVKNHRGISFSKEVLQEQDAGRVHSDPSMALIIPGSCFVNSELIELEANRRDDGDIDKLITFPTTSNRQSASHYSFKSVKNAPSGMLVEQPPTEDVPLSAKKQDNIRAYVVTDENIFETLSAQEDVANIVR